MLSNSRGFVYKSRKEQAIKAYKQLLRDAIERCPAGTKRRIAERTGTSKSFVSQICKPDYTVPLPGKHVETVLEICALSEDEAAAFRAAYSAAHPPSGQNPDSSCRNELRIPLPDFENAEQRRKIEEAIRASAETIINLVAEQHAGR